MAGLHGEGVGCGHCLLHVHRDRPCTQRIYRYRPGTCSCRLLGLHRCRLLRRHLCPPVDHQTEQREKCNGQQRDERTDSTLSIPNSSRTTGDVHCTDRYGSIGAAAVDCTVMVPGRPGNTMSDRSTWHFTVTSTEPPG